MSVASSCSLKFILLKIKGLIKNEQLTKETKWQRKWRHQAFCLLVKVFYLSHMFEGDHVFAVAPKFMLIDGSNHSTSRLCVDPADQILYGN